MGYSSATNFIHSDTLIFGGADPGIHYRNPGSGKLVFLPFGLVNANKILGVDSNGLPALLEQATFSLSDDSVTNAKLSNVPTATLKGRISAGSGDPEDLSISQIQTLLSLGGAAYRSVGSAPSNLVEVLGSGFIDPALIPAIKTHEFVQVANTAARLALTSLQVQPGDEAYEIDTGRTYKLGATDPSVSGNWILQSDASVNAADIVGVLAPSQLGSNSGDANRFLNGLGNFVTVQGKDPLVVVAANSNLAINTRVYSNGATRLSLALPTVAPQGSQIVVTDISANGYRVTQSAGQQIFFPDGSSSTLGASGYIESTLGDGITAPRSRYCQIVLECIGTNNTWLVTQMNSVVTYI